jgi:hypothetical protein
LQIFKSGGTRAFGSLLENLDLTILKGKVISDSYELIEVASPKIKPDAKIANLLKEKSCLSRTN